MFKNIRSFVISLVDPHYDWKIRHPDLAAMHDRIGELEKDSHPMKELHEFEVWPELNKRIEKLEEWSHPPVAPGGATEIIESISKLEKRISELEKK